LLLVIWLVAAVVLIASGFWLGRRASVRHAEVTSAGTNAVVTAIAGAASAERTEVLRAAEIGGRDEARALSAAADTFCQVREAEIEARDRRLGERELELETRWRTLDDRQTRFDRSADRLDKRLAEIESVRAEASALASGALDRLAGAAGETPGAARAAIRAAEVEDAQLAATRAERAAVDTATQAAVKLGRRLIGISTDRYEGHYLTERLLSNVPLGPPEAAEVLIGPDGANLRAISEVTGIGLALGERRDTVRLEGLDGVAREVTRRTLARLARDPRLASEPASVIRVAREIVGNLERETLELGRRAFAELGIAPAHGDIVKLVGRLNYRTSFTQNQWKHALEAAFLCGMMADELGLDRGLARRAALMHDIGKSLTHELDGSHAVIGADYARRLGEPEVVANAIGAHHTDEPFNSPYAYLVAAADALSGARPGARRQTDDNYLARIEDLQRIARGFQGVAEAYAVQGGREIRVYVAEDAVDDLGAVALSSAIAAKISAEMRFPGQIRVTVIRALQAVAVAS
jgi:ribonucrease Y